MYKYSIYTEKKNQESIILILKSYDLDFTLQEGIGSFEGKTENSLLLTIFNNEDLYPKLVKVIKEINSINSQVCSILTVEKLERFYFI